MEEKDFNTLLQGNDVDSLKGQMTCNNKRIRDALTFYNAKEHKISKQPKMKMVGEDEIPNWPMALPIQKKIVESTVAFLVGKPVRLIQESENTDYAYDTLHNVWKEMR